LATPNLFEIFNWDQSLKNEDEKRKVTTLEKLLLLMIFSPAPKKSFVLVKK
jgi:hypothetical protein